MSRELHLGTSHDGSKLLFPEEGLLRHILCMGSSGSGKTVACKVIVEECVRNNIPVIAIDPQGDLASLGLRPEKGSDPSISADYFSRVDLKIWTPGSSAGIPVSLSPTMVHGVISDPEERIRAFGAVADSISALAGYDILSDSGQATSVAFSMIMEYAAEHNLRCSLLGDIVNFLLDPPYPLAEKMDPIISGKERSSIAKKLIVRTSGAKRLLFDLGDSINIDCLFGYDKGGASDQGKTRVSVIYLNSLSSQAEKEAFVASLANAMYSRMIQWAGKSASGRKVLGLFYLDEAAPYLPPSNKKQPVSKMPLLNLLRQARKYGFGCLYATQSPGDVDYVAFSQASTLILGRMNTRQEAEKVHPALATNPNVPADQIVDVLPALKPGQLIICSPSNYSTPVGCNVRWLVSDHKCLDLDRVSQLTKPADRDYYGKP